MKNQIITDSIVLSRTDFQEADRILTLITPHNGKLKVIAKGVRRPRSKLAGGIELLSINTVTVLPGRGEMGTLVSSRLQQHFSNILKDINKTMLAYDLLKRINRVTEDEAGEEYFVILRLTLEALNDLDMPSNLLELWFTMQILNVSGHMPNLKTDTSGQRLEPDEKYIFDYEHMAFRLQKGAVIGRSQIQLMRLAYALDQPLQLKKVLGADKSTETTLSLAKNILRHHVRV